MRPDDRFERGAGPIDGPLDADLTGLDAELADAGAYARRAHAGQSRPTAAFSSRLRTRLLADAASAMPGGAGQAPADRSMPAPSAAEPGASWTPTPLAPRVAAQQPVPAPRARWFLVAAAALSLVAVAGALGARVTWLNPDATAGPTAAATVAALLPTAEPTSGADAPTDVPSSAIPPTSGPTAEPVTTPGATTEPTHTPAPVEPTPKPTTHPEPTQPPVGPMDLVATACPGGVVLDWTKPSVAATHYHSHRGTGEVPSTWPADGAIDVATAASWSADVTSGFDTTADGGATVSYRSFAFDGADHQIAFSPFRVVTTVGKLALGTPTIENLGAGRVRVGWLASEITAACFSVGRVVVSEADPDPSFLKGSTVAATVSDRLATSVLVDSLPSGGTYWIRYEILRATGTGSFVVARTTAIQVTIA